MRHRRGPIADRTARCDAGAHRRGETISAVDLRARRAARRAAASEVARRRETRRSPLRVRWEHKRRSAFLFDTSAAGKLLPLVDLRGLERTNPSEEVKRRVEEAIEELLVDGGPPSVVVDVA